MKENNAMAKRNVKPVVDEADELATLQEKCLDETGGVRPGASDADLSRLTQLLRKLTPEDDKAMADGEQPDVAREDVPEADTPPPSVPGSAQTGQSDDLAPPDVAVNLSDAEQAELAALEADASRVGVHYVPVDRMRRLGVLRAKAKGESA
jgi:hypothetical protein